MTLSELLGKRVQITTQETYPDVNVVDVNNPLFISVKNRAGTIIFIAWNSITEIRYFPPENRRKPRASKTQAGAAAADNGSDANPKVH